MIALRRGEWLRDVVTQLLERGACVGQLPNEHIREEFDRYGSKYK